MIKTWLFFYCLVRSKRKSCWYSYENELQNGSGSEDVDDGDWAEPIEDGVNAVSAQIGKFIISKDLEKSVDERLDMLHNYFLKAKENETLHVRFLSYFFILGF